MLEWESPLAQWRQALADKIGPDANVLDELEGHLREQIEQFIRQGHAPQEAVRLAIAKVGTPETLAPEFAKIAQPWWPIRFVTAGTLLFCGLLLWMSLVRSRGVEQDGLFFTHLLTILLGYVLTYSIGILAVCYAIQRSYRDLSLGQKTSWTRALAGMSLLALVLTLTGIVTGAIWSSIHRGQLWSWDPREYGGLVIAGWQIVAFFLVWRYRYSTRWQMCWGLMGNLAVTYGWFLATYFRELHAYEYPATSLVVAVTLLLIVHGLLLASGLASSGWMRLRTR